MIKGKDNTLLVEFEFVVDLDLAMFKFIKHNYYYSDLVNKPFLSLTDEQEIVLNMLDRKHINPLEYLLPGYDTENLYYDIMGRNEDAYKELLSFAKVYDTFGLMITYLREASSVSIDILCKNEIEQEFIHNLNNSIHTVVYDNKANVPINMYSALYVKYFVYLMQYRGVSGKHLYVPLANFNMEETEMVPNKRLSGLFTKTNVIHLIDLYRYAKFRIPKS